MTELFHSGGSVKNWNILKTEYALQNQDHFCWLQRRAPFTQGFENYHTRKVSSKELYSFLIFAIDHPPTSQKYFGNFFPNIGLPWKEVYLTARKATPNSQLRCFHYKIINNALYLNQRVFQFGKPQSPLSSFCISEAGTTLHVFS